MSNNRFPLYIVSKGRAESRLTSKALEAMGMPYYIVIEEQEYGLYSAVIDRAKILVLDQAYQREYDALVPLRVDESKGSGPARNFAWDHSISTGYDWHWCMDDNIRYFMRLNHNTKARVVSSAFWTAMEDFCLRYTNVAMAGPNYQYFAKQNQRLNPIILNTRIFSCNLIRNDIPFRWRGRYNEDADLSLRILKAGWCTIQFNAFLQGKTPTGTKMKGGNTDEIYKRGTLEKSQLLARLHPDVCRVTYRFGRPHHYANYRPFKKNKLIRRTDIEIPSGSNEYGMRLVPKTKQ